MWLRLAWKQMWRVEKWTWLFFHHVRNWRKFWSISPLIRKFLNLKRHIRLALIDDHFRVRLKAVNMISRSLMTTQRQLSQQCLQSTTSQYIHWAMSRVDIWSNEASHCNRVQCESRNTDWWALHFRRRATKKVTSYQEQKTRFSACTSFPQNERQKRRRPLSRHTDHAVGLNLSSNTWNQVGPILKANIG